MKVSLGVLVSFAAVAACTVASEKPVDTAAGRGGDANRGPQGAPAATQPAANTDEAWTARADGAGPIRVGMTAAEARKALGLDASATAGAEGCSYLKGAGNTRLHATIMLSSDTVVRVDVVDTVLKTREGARVGNSEAEIQQMYAGRVTVQPHKYVAGGHYLVVTAPGSANNRLVFETDGKVVTRYRVGREPEVEYVESCS